MVIKENNFINFLEEMMKKDLIFTDGSTLALGNIYCIAKNYSKHAAEMQSTVPKSPSVFIKPSTAYIKNNENIVIPDISQMVHHEVELVVVIGKDCINVTKDDAENYIAGYAVGIDVTLRDIQNKAKESGSPWAICKGFATSAPISDVIPINTLSEKIPFFDLSFSVNGVTKQQGNTKDMERSVGVLIEYLSKIFHLHQGDCIFTGTPEGVGQIVKGDTLTAELVGYAKLKVNVE